VQDYKAVLDQIEQRWGVDRYVVLGVWGMETNFGRFTGDKSTIRCLATLADARYRGDFFRKELVNALVILQQGHTAPAQMKGSWAGAMGHTQFMPSSFMLYAVDFDGDGHKDIWNNIPDALASTANYLAEHGWIRGWTWGYEVILPDDFVVDASDTRDHAFSEWAARNLRRVDGETMPTQGSARLLQPAGSAGPTFLVTKNFDVIKRYNNSTSYSLGVALLSDRLAGSGPLMAKWPARTDPVSTASIRRDTGQ
jgi:lytic murein transglycosylase